MGACKTPSSWESSTSLEGSFANRSIWAGLEDLAVQDAQLEHRLAVVLLGEVRKGLRRGHRIVVAKDDAGGTSKILEDVGQLGLVEGELRQAVLHHHVLRARRA